MICRIKYIFIAVLSMIFAEAAGQNGQVMYYMNLPQNHLMNPAMHPTNSFYIGLPAISGTSLNINNNFINYSDLFSKSTSSDSVITFLHPDYKDDFLAGIKNRNSISPQISLQTFGLGFAAGKGLYFYLDINERIEGNAVFPGDIIRLVLEGNEGFVGDEIDLSSLRMDLRYFREYGFTVSKAFSDKLSIGIRPKMFTGGLALSVENKSLGISVTEDYTHILDADLTVNMSDQFDVYMNDSGNIDSITFDDSGFKSAQGLYKMTTDTKNMGFGLDLGATYKILDKLTVSAAVTDIGYINWKKDVTNLTARSQFVFSGIDITDVMTGTKTIDEVGNELLDSLKDSFTVTKSNDPFTTWLSPGLTLGGNYKLSEIFSFGLLSYSRFIGKQVRESLTLSANLNLNNALSLSLGYSLQNQRADNLGAGLAFRAGIFQFYLITDRIPVNWNRIIIDDNSSVILPENLNTINLRVGMNLSFGNNLKKRNDKPMIQNEQTF